MVVHDEPPILIDRGAFNQGINAQYDTHISDDPVSPSLVARGPHAVFTKSKRPQTATDDETWVANQPNPTLNAFDQGDTRTTTVIVQDPIVFENSYRDAARIAEDGITQTLTSKMGTGGGNTPMVAFATNQRAEVRELDDKAVALSAEPGTNQQTYVAFGLQGNMIGRQDHNGPQGAGISQPDDPMFSLTSTDRHAVATTMAVRRLTPLECERLMGWPDDWTAGQSDTHRYKQCGNGVASPVAQWIAQQLLKLNTP
jgi:DNA (cytosine-5)-methyltransferase 1